MAGGVAETDEAANPPGAAGLRPEVLWPWFAGLGTLPGIGPACVRLLARLLGADPPRMLDLLAHLPIGTLDPRPVASLDARSGPLTIAATILGHRPAAPGGRMPHRIQVAAAGSELDLVYFRARGPGLERRFPLGTHHLLWGEVTWYGGRPQMAHPERLAPDPPPSGQLALYPLTAGLTQRRLRGAIEAALDRLTGLPEWLDEATQRQQHLPGLRAALAALHRPEDAGAIAAASPARRRLALDELLAGQLALAIARRRRQRRPGRALRGDGHLTGRLLATLPFQPTPCQVRATAEIAADLAAPLPMLRLLQGDVGSGKTLVALLAMLQAVEAGAQAAMMTPTELLARQHAATCDRLLGPIGLRTALLTGREPPAHRRRVLDDLAAGTARIVVGTHALFQDEVRFDDLGLAVIDEQHRFGVGQRLELAGKGSACDLLLTTATPIPRSMLLALYGDLPTSELRTRPPGRPPVTTRAVPQDRLEELLEACARALDAHAQIYWICPTIEGGIDDDPSAAVARHAALRERFGTSVGLAHGRLSAADKEAALAAFAAGATRLLVATTVVEVGIDVPDATVIVIEEAQRFGLAQLHQLRGRVGRGTRPSSCLLLYGAPLTAAGKARLKAIRATDDGFRLAEHDLRLRGPGEALGTRQSGLPPWRFVELPDHASLVPLARDLAARALELDPGLTGASGRALRLLLHLFERHGATRHLAAG